VNVIASEPLETGVPAAAVKENVTGVKSGAV